MSDENKSGLKGSGRTALIISLAFNIFFVGTVVGGAVVGERFHHRAEQVRHAPPIHSFASPRKLLRHVDREDRRDLVKVLRSEMKDLRPELKRIGELRRNAMDILKAEPFDEEAARKAFADLAKAEAEVHEASNQTFIKLLKAMPQEDRQAALESMRKHRMEKRRFERRRYEEGRRFRDRQESEKSEEEVERP